MTRGGRNTKIHAIVDGLGNPLYVQLSGGQVSDISVAYDLLDQVDPKGQLSWQIRPMVQQTFA